MTPHVYLIQNQDKLLLGRQRQWLNGHDPGAWYKTPHKDEAVNEMFEINARDYSQRLSLVHCPLNDKGHPQLDPSLLPVARVGEPEVSINEAASNHPSLD